MKISIGILAYNEEKVIGDMLDSLFRQSVFLPDFKAGGGEEWEIIVVPNGCSDQTAVVAEKKLEIFSKQTTNCSYKVEQVERPGKSNAWNLFVHEFSDKNAEILILMDADIEFDDKNTLQSCLQVLKENSHASIVVDLPRKHFEVSEKKGFREKMSLRASRVTLESNPAISGQFYCGRTLELRQIWMPLGLPVEDGFLYSMIVTNGFRQEPDMSKVVRAKGASHFFEGLYRISDLYRHELRITIGTALNCYFTWDFLRFATDANGPGAGEFIRSQLVKNPKWYESVLNNQIANRGWWVLPRGMLFRRFDALNGKPLVRKISRLPITLIAFCLDIPVFIAANRTIKKRQAIGFW
ncbi:MAG: glycosyltransferase family 2 protein [Pseudomonadota bacterium]